MTSADDRTCSDAEAPEVPHYVKIALAYGFEARAAALNEDINDFIGAFNVGALAFYTKLRELENELNEEDGL